MADNPENNAVYLAIERMRSEMVERLVRIEQRQENGADNANQRHDHVMKAIASFVPRPEIEAMHDNLTDRIIDLEKAQSKLTWGLITTMGGLILSTVWKKLGLGG